MAYVKRKLQFNAGDRVAQLRPFPYIKAKAMPGNRASGRGLLKSLATGPNSAYFIENVCL